MTQVLVGQGLTDSHAFALSGTWLPPTLPLENAGTSWYTTAETKSLATLARNQDHERAEPDRCPGGTGGSRTRPGGLHAAPADRSLPDRGGARPRRFRPRLPGSRRA